MKTILICMSWITSTLAVTKPIRIKRTYGAWTQTLFLWGLASATEKSPLDSPPAGGCMLHMKMNKRTRTKGAARVQDRRFLTSEPGNG